MLSVILWSTPKNDRTFWVRKRTPNCDYLQIYFALIKVCCSQTKALICRDLSHWSYIYKYIFITKMENGGIIQRLTHCFLVTPYSVFDLDQYRMLHDGGTEPIHYIPIPLPCLKTPFSSCSEFGFLNHWRGIGNRCIRQFICIYAFYIDLTKSHHQHFAGTTT